MTGSSFAGGGSRGRPGSATRAAFEKDLNVARQIASGVLPVQRGPRGANSIRTLLTMAVTQPRKGAVSAAVGYPAGIGHRGRYRYISWVLFGTKRMVPRNFLRDAFKAHIQTYMTAIKEAYYASFPGMGPVGVAVGEHQAAEAAAEKAAAKRARALPIPEEALGFFMGQRTLEGATDPFELLSARQEAAQRARQFDSEALRPYIEVDSKED